MQNDLALNAPESFNFILLRKIEVEEPEVEINVSWIYELKFGQEWEAEIFFVQNNFSFYDFSVISLEEGKMVCKFFWSNNHNFLPCPAFVYFTIF